MSFRRLAACLVIACSAHAVPSALASFAAWKPAAIPAAAASTVVAHGEMLVVLRDDGDALASRDGGLAWQPLAIDGERPRRVQIAPSAPNTWYAVAGRSLYRSDDAGLTWSERSRDFTPLDPFTGPAYMDVRVGAAPDLLYAVRQESVSCWDGCRYGPGRAMVSADGGSSWTQIALDGVADTEGLGGIYPSPVDAQVVHANRGTEWLVSGNRGAAFEDRSPKAPGKLPSALWNHAIVTLDRHDADIAYLRAREGWGEGALLNPLWITRDGGLTWETHMVPRGVVVADPLEAGRAYAFGQDRSVRETRDGGRTWVLVEAPSGTRIEGFFDGFDAGIAIRGGRRVAIFVHSRGVEELDLADGALALGSDLWWNPAEPGTGVTITHRGTRQAFVVWYAFDAAGNPVWRVVPGGTWSDRTFTGPLYETRGGPWFGAAFDAQVEVRRVGEASLAFTDADNAEFRWRFDGGGEGAQPLARQLFGPVAVPKTSEKLGDLWWNEAEPGWGIAINHQHNTIFATWFVYDDAGNPEWVVMPDAPIAMAFLGIRVRPTATGDVYAARAGEGGVVVTRRGTATITFPAADRAVLEYVVAGTAGRKEITRQPF